MPALKRLNAPNVKKLANGDFWTSRPMLQFGVKVEEFLITRPLSQPLRNSDYWDAFFVLSSVTLTRSKDVIATCAKTVKYQDRRWFVRFATLLRVEKL